MVTKKAKENITLSDVVEDQNKRYGESTIITGKQMKSDPPRLPTGVFSVDFVCGGGFPVWQTTCLWGPDSSGKSNLCWNAVHMCHSICWQCFQTLAQCKCSKKPLEMRACYLDVEGSADRIWAEQIGADPNKYVLAMADYGEHWANIALQVLKADDCGLLVLDSLAHLAPHDEMAKDFEDQFYALQARLIGRLVRDIKQRLINERKREHPCVVLFTNQMRIKIGQLFGSPEEMSGGKQMKHEFSLLLRCVKKSLGKSGRDASLTPDELTEKPRAERYSFSLRKEKVFVLGGVGEYVRIKGDIPELGLKTGQIDDTKPLLEKAKTYGLVEKHPKGGWKYKNIKATRQEQIIELWAKNWDEKMWAQSEVIRMAKARMKGEI